MHNTVCCRLCYHLLLFWGLHFFLFWHPHCKLNNLSEITVSKDPKATHIQYLVILLCYNGIMYIVNHFYFLSWYKISLDNFNLNVSQSNSLLTLECVCCIIFTLRHTAQCLVKLSTCIYKWKTWGHRISHCASTHHADTSTQNAEGEMLKGNQEPCAFTVCGNICMWKYSDSCK